MDLCTAGLVVINVHEDNSDRPALPTAM